MTDTRQRDEDGYPIERGLPLPVHLDRLPRAKSTAPKALHPNELEAGRRTVGPCRPHPIERVKREWLIAAESAGKADARTHPGWGWWLCQHHGYWHPGDPPEEVTHALT